MRKTFSKWVLRTAGNLIRLYGNVSAEPKIWEDSVLTAENPLLRNGYAPAVQKTQESSVPIAANR